MDIQTIKELRENRQILKDTLGEDVFDRLVAARAFSHDIKTALNCLDQEILTQALPDQGILDLVA